jgi:hypothetical protein
MNINVEDCRVALGVALVTALTADAHQGRPCGLSGRPNRAERLKQKPGTVSRPGAIGAVREFQFRE